MIKHPDFKCNLDHIFIDNLDNDFLFKSGAWPEGYFLTDKKGIVRNKWTVTNSC